MKINHFKCVILLYLLTGYSLQAGLAPLVISPNGPFSPMEETRLRVRELKTQQLDQQIEVLIKEGVYPLRQTVVLGLEDFLTDCEQHQNKLEKTPQPFR